MQLRPYQSEAKSAILRELEENQSTLLTIPTGCGKTIIFAHVAKHYTDSGKRVLILAHRGELLEQAQDKLRKAVGLSSSLEKAESHADRAALVIVASVQTLSRESRLLEYPGDFFDLIIVDEAHHAVTESYTRIFDHFSTAKRLGVTATPNRSDLRSISTIFETTAYQYDIKTAIEEGYLSPIVIQRSSLNIDLSGVSIVHGDYLASDLGAAIEPYLEQIARQIERKAAGRKLLIFVPLVRTGELFSRILTQHGRKCACISAQNPDREAIRDAFASGELDTVCNAMLWTEGYDNPSVDCIINLRATKSMSLYTQILGRGLRPAPGKENLLVLDFLWHSKNYNVLSPVQLFLDEKDAPYAEDVLADRNGEEIALDDLMMLAENRRVDAEIALARKLKAIRREHLTLGLQPFCEVPNENLYYQYDENDVLDSLTIQTSGALAFYLNVKRYTFRPIRTWETEPPTDSQKETLEKMGVPQDTVPFKGLASIVIDAYMKRMKKGLCTYKQAAFLEKRGFSHTKLWSRDSAAKMMDKIAKNNWRVPYGIRPNKYRPADLMQSANTAKGV